jgi:hypothetical protein
LPFYGVRAMVPDQNAPKWVNVMVCVSVFCGNILAKTPRGTGKANFYRKKYFDVLEKNIKGR